MVGQQGATTIMAMLHNIQGLQDGKNSTIHKLLYMNAWHYNYNYCVRHRKNAQVSNMDLSRDFMGQRCRGCMDLGTHIWHPPQIFFAGADDITKEREPGIEIIKCTP